MATKSTKKDRHPPHLAREIRGMFSGQFSAWSIYPEQLEAMARRMQRRLTHLRARVITGRQADLLICRQLLREIGLVPPATPLRPAGRPPAK